MEPDESFAAWVRGLRSRLGLSQELLGRRVGVSQATVGRWELGKSRPPRATRGRLVELAEGAGLGPPPDRGEEGGV
jgi:transcriptional regulator with XRE-family HTH domain